MIKLWLLALLITPLIQTADSITLQKEDGATPPVDAMAQQLPGTPEAPLAPDLQQIESFSVVVKGPWDTQAGAKDQSIAVIVNPFSVRKRGKTYGSVYEYHRNDNFDARNFFDPLGARLPEYKRNQFGFSLGAFVTDKLKVFGGYDGLRIIKGSTLLSLVTTPQMKQGDFSALKDRNLIDPWTGSPFPDNHIPASRIHPVAAKMLHLFPDPNRNDPTRNYVNNQPNVNNSNTITARADYEFNSKTKLFGSYNLADGNQLFASSLPSFAAKTDERRQSISIDLIHSFNPSKVLSLSADYNRSSSFQLSQHSFQKGLLASLGIEGIAVSDPIDEGYPAIELIGYAGLTFGWGFSGWGFGSTPPNISVQNNYSLKADYTYVRGKHTLQLSNNLGFRQLNGSRTWATRRGQFSFSGQFSGDAFADFLLGIPYAAVRGIGSDRADLRQSLWELSAKDEWKINRHFTLSMAIAYSYASFPYSLHNNVSLFFPLLFEPPLDGEIVITGTPRARKLGLNLKRGRAAYNDHNDWEPALGLAYSPFGNNKLVLRASYSIFHSSLNHWMAQNYIGRNYPFFYYERAESPTKPDLDLSRPFASAAVPAQTIQAMDPYLRNPYIQQRDLSLQYEFLRNWSFELGYRGRKTTRLNRTIPANVPLPARAGSPIQERRPNPAYGRFEILTSSSSYTSNELTAQLKRRLTGAFSIQADFLWSKAISDGWGWAFSNPNNPRNLAAERSIWGFQPPKQLTLNYILDLPLGRGRLISTTWAGKFSQLFEDWRISGITTIMDGPPFHPEIFGDPNNDGVWGDRPNRIGPGSLARSKRSIDKWFETSHFAVPDFAAPDQQWFGNSGRNILLGPAEHKWDISILKRTRVSRDGNLLEFRVQLFNAFNHANFQQPGNYIGTPTFGVISNADNAREIEVAIKYTF